MGTTKEEILDYVMGTPGNTNRAVLSSLLNDQSASDEAVTYTEQEPTTAQQMQARKNLGLYYIELGTPPDPIVWDTTDRDGKISFSIGTGSQLLTYYKVSDSVLSAQDVIGGTVVISSGDEILLESQLSQAQVQQSDGLIAFNYGLSSSRATGGPYNIPEAGTYFMYSPEYEEIGNVTIHLNFPSPNFVHQIEKQYVPKPFTVTFTAQDTKLVADKSFLSTWEALKNNEKVIFKLDGGSTLSFLHCSSARFTGIEGDMILVIEHFNFSDKLFSSWDVIRWKVENSHYETITTKRITID